MHVESWEMREKGKNVREELEHDKPRDPTVNATEELWKVLGVSLDREVEGEDTMYECRLGASENWRPIFLAILRLTVQCHWTVRKIVELRGSRERRETHG